MHLLIWAPREERLVLVSTCPHELALVYRADGAQLASVVRRAAKEGKAELVPGLLHGPGGVETYPVPSPKAVRWLMDKASLAAVISECAECEPAAFAEGATLESATMGLLADLLPPG